MYYPFRVMAVLKWICGTVAKYFKIIGGAIIHRYKAAINYAGFH